MSNFEAQSHSLFSRCLRLATTITDSHPRLATGGWLDLTRQAFHLLDYSPLSGRTIPIEISPVLNHFCYFRNKIANKTIRTNPTTRLTYQEMPLPTTIYTEI